MGAGDYRIYATLEQPIRGTRNEIGESEITWESVADVWISVAPLRSSEIFWARQAKLQTTHKVRCRWFRELKSDMRFTWLEPDGTKRILNINAKQDVEERHIEWVLECTEQSSG